MSAGLSPRPASRWRSTQLSVKLSRPPGNQAGQAGPREPSRTLSGGRSQRRPRSRTTAVQYHSMSATDRRCSSASEPSPWARMRRAMRARSATAGVGRQTISSLLIGLLCLLLDGLDLDIDPHLVTNQHAPRFQRTIPAHAPVVALDDRGGRRAHPTMALRVADGRRRSLDLQDHLAGNVADREVTDELEALGLGVLDALGLEGDGRESLGVEEIVGSQVFVAPAVAGVDALSLDRDV